MSRVVAAVHAGGSDSDEVVDEVISHVEVGVECDIRKTHVYSTTTANIIASSTSVNHTDSAGGSESENEGVVGHDDSDDDPDEEYLRLIDEDERAAEAEQMRAMSRALRQPEAHAPKQHIRCVIKWVWK